MVSVSRAWGQLHMSRGGNRVITLAVTGTGTGTGPEQWRTIGVSPCPYSGAV